MKDNELDAIFQSHVEHVEELPNPEIWNRINHELAEQEKRNSKKVVKKTLWYFGTAAAVAIMVGIFAFWYTQNKAPIASQEIVSQRDLPPFERETPKMEGPTSIQKKSEESLLPKPEKIVISLIAKTSPSSTPIESTRTIKKPYDDTPNQQVLAAQVEKAMFKADTIKHQITLPNPTASLEAPPLKPLVQNPEEEDTMIARTDSPNRKPISIGGILNSLIGKVDKSEGKTLEFHTDEEGSISIQYIAKNKKKNK